MAWTPLRATVRRNPLSVFFILAYGLSWIPWLLQTIELSPGGGSGINSFGPFLAAIIVAGITAGREGLTDLLRRLVHWRVPVRWYLVALLLPVVLMSLAALINIGLGAPRPSPAQLAAWPAALAAFPLILALDGPLGEELGWRGYALPRLLERTSPLRASVRLGLLWAGWHLPLFVARPGAWIPGLVVWIVSAAVVLTWLHRATGGSVLLATLMHASVNTIGGGFISPMFTGTYSDRQFWLAASLWAATAAIVAPFLATWSAREQSRPATVSP